MNKIHFGFLICVVLGAMTCSCKESEENIKENEMFYEEKSVSDSKWGSFGEKGALFVDEKHLVHYLDYQSGEDMIHCFNINCEHIPYDEISNPDPICEAVYPEKKEIVVDPVVFLSGKYVYYLSGDSYTHASLYRSNIIGGKRELIGEIENCTVDRNNVCFVNNGIAYSLMQVPYMEQVDNDFEAGSGVNKWNDVLVRIDLEKGKFKIVSKLLDKKSQNMRIVNENNNKFYYELSYSKKKYKSNEEEPIYENQLYCYDKSTDTDTLLFDEKFLKDKWTVGVYDDILFYIDNLNHELIAYHLQNKTDEIVYTNTSAKNVGDMSAIFLCNGIFITDNDKAFYYDIPQKKTSERLGWWTEDTTSWPQMILDNTIRYGNKYMTKEQFLKQNGTQIAIIPNPLY